MATGTRPKAVFRSVDAPPAPESHTIPRYLPERWERAIMIAPGLTQATYMGALYYRAMCSYCALDNQKEGSDGTA